LGPFNQRSFLGSESGARDTYAITRAYTFAVLKPYIIIKAYALAVLKLYAKLRAYALGP
jgi:hypothetical protein